VSRSRRPLTVDDHRAAAAGHLAFADGLRAAASADPFAVRWAVTATFYAVLHALSASRLHRHGVASEEHRDRWAWFRAHPELRRFEATYRGLYDASRLARYHLEPVTWADWDALRLRARHLVEKWLKDATP
jgi:hypothetical protein